MFKINKVVLLVVSSAQTRLGRTHRTQNEVKIISHAVVKHCFCLIGMNSLRQTLMHSCHVTRLLSNVFHFIDNENVFIKSLQQGNKPTKQSTVNGDRNNGVV